MEKKFRLSPNVYRVSRRGNASLDNQFFAALENDISDALIGDAHSFSVGDNAHYVCNRLATVDQTVVDALCANLPADIIAELHRCVKGDSLKPAYYEMDFINFLLSSKSNRVLSIVGSVGIGKSTFIRFIFQYLRPRCPSLGGLLPIMVNGLHIGDDEPVYFEIFERLHLDCRDAVANQTAIDNKQEILEALNNYYNDRQRQVGSAPINSTTVIEYFSCLKKVLPPRIEPVMIFDNLDQMSSASVAKISHLSRGIYLRTQVPIVLCMRPPTFATHIEIDANKGAFFTFQIPLPSPNIREVIDLRLRSLLRTNHPVTVSDPNSGFRLVLPDASAALENLNRNILTPWNQELLLKGIACGNIRKALGAFYRFLRFSELDFRNLFGASLDSSHDQSLVSRQHDWHEHFLKGLLVGGSKYYESRPNNPLVNILFVDSIDHDIDYCLTFRLLSCFYFARELVDVKKIQRWLSGLGYDRSFADVVTQKLLKARLLTSPDHETDLRFATHVSISESGKYYYENLITEQTYLYEAIFDVPLSHEAWSPTSTRDFEMRAASILEYIGRVIAQESSQLERLKSASGIAQISAVIKVTGFLSRHILDAAIKVSKIGLRARSSQVMAVAKEFLAELEVARSSVEQLEKNLDDLLVSKSYVAPDAAAENEISWSLGSEGEFIVRHKETLEPAGRNYLRAELRLQFEDEPDVLMAWITPNDPSYETEKVWPLERVPDADFYSGEVIFDDISEAKPFPESSLTVFADSRPLFTREL